MNKKQKQSEVRVARVAIRTSHIRPKNKQGETQEERRRNSEDALSPQMQLDQGRDFCARLELPFDAEASLTYADLDVSGSKIPWRRRPNLIKHYEDAKRGLFTDLIFYKVARAGRNLRDTLDLLDAFESLGISVHGIRDDTASKLVRNVLLSVAEHQAEDISSNIRDTIITRAKRGDIEGRYPLMWLRRDTSGAWEVIPEMEEAMRRLVALRMGGNGYEKTAQRMNEEGLRTITGKTWRAGTVYKYLTPSYIDSMCGDAFLYRELPEDDPDRVVIHGAFPPILTDDEADALRLVQRRYREAPLTSSIPGGGHWQSNIARAGRYRADSKYLLAGILHCPVCGCKLGSLQHGQDRPNPRGYQCLLARTDRISHSAGGMSINADSVEDGVLRVIRHVLKEPPAPRPKAPIMRKSSRTAAHVEQEMEALLNLHLKGMVPEALYTKKYGTLLAEHEVLQRADAEALAPSARDAAETMLAAATEITREQLRQLILLLVRRVETPIVIPGVHVREQRTGLRRHARVYLNIENQEGVSVWLVPLHLPRYQGEKQPPFPAPPAATK